MKKIIPFLLLTLFCSCRKHDFHLPAEPVATWDFRSGSSSSFESTGTERLVLKPGKGMYPSFSTSENSKFLDWKSLEFDGSSDWLYIDSTDVKGLDIKTGELTVVAVVKWSGQHGGFVAGMWDECDNQRQYGLFISLPYYNGENKVCGHISRKGGPTAPFPYSIDYSASAEDVSLDRWHVIAMTYDGEYIKSYIDGEYKEVEPELIDHTAGFKGYPDGLIMRKNPYYYPDGMGSNGSDFTIGAVKMPGGQMGNFFKGAIRRISIFNRCLDVNEIIEFTVNEIRSEHETNLHNQHSVFPTTNPTTE